MNLISAETCVAALNIAAFNRKTAFRVEMAVGLAVFLVHGGAGRDARRMLSKAYNSAGYECVQVTGIDYKTVNRRINATAALYEKLPVKTWAGKHSENNLLAALCAGLEPYEFYGVRDVQRYCSPEKVLPPRRQIVPAPDVLAPGANHTGQDAIKAMFRRASDQVAEGARRVEVGHIAVVIPAETTREELVVMARKLLEMAAETKELLTA